MQNFLIFAVKLARDAGYSDNEISLELRRAADSVKVGGFWPSDVDRQSLAYQNSEKFLRGFDAD